MLLAVDYSLSKPYQLVLVAPKALAELEPMLATLRRHFLPNAVLVGVTEAERERAGALIPLLRDKRAEQHATAYVCLDTVCLTPARSAAELQAQLP